ncbi:MAG: hypothetical protein ABIM99_00345 [Candidatus Dojkabacteria bacterium]
MNNGFDNGEEFKGPVGLFLGRAYISICDQIPTKSNRLTRIYLGKNGFDFTNLEIQRFVSGKHIPNNEEMNVFFTHFYLEYGNKNREKLKELLSTKFVGTYLDIVMNEFDAWCCVEVTARINGNSIIDTYRYEKDNIIDLTDEIVHGYLEGLAEMLANFGINDPINFREVVSLMLTEPGLEPDDNYIDWFVDYHEGLVNKKNI